MNWLILVLSIFVTDGAIDAIRTPIGGVKMAYPYDTPIIMVVDTVPVKTGVTTTFCWREVTPLSVSHLGICEYPYTTFLVVPKGEIKNKKELWLLILIASKRGYKYIVYPDTIPEKWFSLEQEKVLQTYTGVSMIYKGDRVKGLFVLAGEETGKGDVPIYLLMGEKFNNFLLHYGKREGLLFVEGLIGPSLLFTLQRLKLWDERFEKKTGETPIPIDKTFIGKIILWYLWFAKEG